MAEYARVCHSYPAESAAPRRRPRPKGETMPDYEGTIRQLTMSLEWMLGKAERNDPLTPGEMDSVRHTIIAAKALLDG